jgi:putative peptide zinc metalloprotease protein
VVAILSWILDQFFFVGLVLGLFAGIGWIGVPLYKGLRFLLTSPQIRRVRARAIVVCGAAALSVGLLLAWLPAPLRTQVEGVVWVPDEALVRAGSEGFVREVMTAPGARVEKGQVLVVLEDPELETRRTTLEARVDELSARMAAQRTADLVAAQLTAEELGYARDSLSRVRERVADLAVRAGRAGRFSVVRPQDLPGRFVRKGELLGHVVDPEKTRVRAVVGQDDVQLVTRRLVATRVRLAERVSEVRDARLLRVVPAASEQLPSSVLGSGGGGEVPVDPRDPQGERAVQKMFEVELEIPASGAVVHAGGRVHVRFDLGSEPLGVQWARRLRQIFLSRFQV